MEKRTTRTLNAAIVIPLLLLAVGAGCRPGAPEQEPTTSPTDSPLPTPPAAVPLSPLPTSPLPTAEQISSRLLFHSNRSGNYDIYLLDLGTGAVERLTDSTDHEIEPTISPDGTRIAFARTRAAPRGQDIYVMAVDGADAQRITYMEDSIAMSPDWSPDGSEIIFYATQTSRFHIFSVSPEGGDVRELPGGNQNDLMPDWSPDGSQIVFVSDRDGRADLYVMAADGSNQERLTDSMGDEQRPRWSPDGQTIVFQADYETHRELYRLVVETGEIEQLTSGGAESEMPAWSGDGRLIYYTHQEQEGHNLYVLDLEQQEPRRLTETLLVSDRYPVWIGSGDE